MQLSEDSTASCVLPFEIVEIIIDLLAEENDTDSLKAMSLVCLSVLPRCRKYLFFTIKIYPDCTEKCLALSSPHTDIPKYIRRLEYWAYDKLFPSHPALLERISFLQSLTLTAFHCIDIPSAQSTLLKLMHLPSLTHLCLRGFIVPDLFSCANLKHLQLSCVDIPRESQCTLLPFESDNSNVPRIQEYSFSRSAKTAKRLSTAKLVDGRLALDFTNLKKLSVDLLTDEDFDATLSLLRKSKQVEELRIFGCHGVADIIMAFHTVGTTLSLTLVTRDFYTLCDGLSGIPTTNNTLRSLRLEIFSLDSLSGGYHWENMDAVLSSLRWLEDVSIDILFSDSGSIREKQKSLAALINMQLTGLLNRTSPNFKFSAQLKHVSRPEMYCLEHRRIRGVGL